MVCVFDASGELYFRVRALMTASYSNVGFDSAGEILAVQIRDKGATEVFDARDGRSLRTLEDFPASIGSGRQLCTRRRQDDLVCPRFDVLSVDLSPEPVPFYVELSYSMVMWFRKEGKLLAWGNPDGTISDCFGRSAQANKSESLIVCRVART
jgi:hypothetical protein